MFVPDALLDIYSFADIFWQVQLGADPWFSL